METSPYLLQHAHNPVNWWSWEDAAFEEAKSLINRYYCQLVTPHVIGVM